MKGNLQAILAYYLMKLTVEQLSGSTKRSYASLTRQFFHFVERNSESMEGEIAVGSFIPLAQQFLASERDGKASSINARASAIKHFLKVTGMPCETLERPQTRLTTREPLTDDELSAFLEAARRFKPRDKAIAQIFATTGIRLKECASLNLDDLDYIEDSLMLAVDRSGRRQQIPLNAETQKAVEEYLETREGTEDVLIEADQPLFVDKNGERLSMRALTASVRKIGWAARLAVTPALLRLTRLIQIARRGNDAVTLAYLGGFDSLESAKRLIRAARNDLTCAAIQAGIDEILGPDSHSNQ